MITKTSKLSASLKTFIQCIGGFLEAFQKIADCAYSSNCGLRELGSSMTRFCLRERGLESRLRTFNRECFYFFFMRFLICLIWNDNSFVYIKL
ncbi:unnamed protein product [Trichobilharzia szidati]|nr:unnamed protein product [Trichobilharzia szidati]